MTAMPPPPPSSLTVELMVSHGLAAALGSQFADCSLPFRPAWALPLTASAFKGLGSFSTQVCKDLLPHIEVVELLQYISNCKVTGFDPLYWCSYRKQCRTFLES